VESMVETRRSTARSWETTGTGFVILDGQGIVLDANQEYVRLTGREDLTEILGKSVIEWTAEYDKKGTRSKLRNVSSRGS